MSGKFTQIAAQFQKLEDGNTGSLSGGYLSLNTANDRYKSIIQGVSDSSDSGYLLTGDDDKNPKECSTNRTTCINSGCPKSNNKGICVQKVTF